MADAIDAERERQAEFTRTGDWRDAKVPINGQCWLFPSEAALPPTNERFNAAWHVVPEMGNLQS